MPDDAEREIFERFPTWHQDSTMQASDLEYSVRERERARECQITSHLEIIYGVQLTFNFNCKLLFMIGQQPEVNSSQQRNRSLQLH